MALMHDEIYQLEESLWKPEARFDEAYMRGIMTSDFFEFGRSGKTYTIDESLSAPMQEIPINLPLRDFTIHPVSDDVVLVTYTSEVHYDTYEVANRSSLWGNSL